MFTHSGDTSAIVLRLRLVVARAAQRDSLAWWEDEALTPGADLLLRRLFPRSVSRAACTLALRAARARHKAVLVDWPGAQHLFDFGSELENQIDQVFREQKSPNVPRDPIRSREELADFLRVIAPEPSVPIRRLTDSQRTTQLGNEVVSLPVADRAITLAWAYATPDAAGLVVPFYLPDSEGI